MDRQADVTWDELPDPPRNVVVFSGHMIDTPDRGEPRFPAACEDEVRERIAGVLAGWEVGPGDLAICGGARGGDILFAELCLERGAEVAIYLALPVPEFISRSVELPDSDWTARFRALLDRCTVVPPPDDAGEPGSSPFERNNARMLAAAREAASDRGFLTLLVWNRQPGDGQGGTADFARAAETLGGQVTVVDSMCEAGRRA